MPGWPAIYSYVTENCDDFPIKRSAIRRPRPRELRAKLRDQAFDAIGALWRRRQSERWTQKRVADAIGRDPAWVSRNLRAPGNRTLRTIGKLIQALDGESEIAISPLEAPLEARSNDHAYTAYIQTRAVTEH